MRSNSSDRARGHARSLGGLCLAALVGSVAAGDNGLETNECYVALSSDCCATAPGYSVTCGGRKCFADNVSGTAFSQAVPAPTGVYGWSGWQFADPTAAGDCYYDHALCQPGSPNPCLTHFTLEQHVCPDDPAPSTSTDRIG